VTAKVISYGMLRVGNQDFANLVDKRLGGRVVRINNNSSAPIFRACLWDIVSPQTRFTHPELGRVEYLLWCALSSVFCGPVALQGIY
jgi:hypothetical protein